MNTRIVIFLAATGVVTSTMWSAETAPRTVPSEVRVVRGASASTPEAQLLHRWEGVHILGFNPQGRLLVYNGARRDIEVHDLADTNAPVGRWNYPQGGKQATGAISPDGRTLALVSDAGQDQSRIQLWNSATGERVGPVFAPTDVGYLTFSPDGKSLAGVVARDGTVRIWDVATGELRSSGSLPEPMQVAWTGIEYSPDGRYLGARNSYAVSLWKVTGPKPVPLGNDSIYLSISPDWKFAQGVLNASTAGQDLRVVLLHFTNPETPIPASAPLTNEIENLEGAAAFSADGRLLAVRMSNQSLHFFDLVQRRKMDRPSIKVGQPVRIFLSPDNRMLVTYELGSARPRTSTGNVRVWDTIAGQPCGPPHPVPGMVMDCDFDREGRFLVLSFLQGNGLGAQVWRLPNPITQVKE